MRCMILLLQCNKHDIRLILPFQEYFRLVFTQQVKHVGTGACKLKQDRCTGVAVWIKGT